ncbi:MAG: aspartate carbamoyltransferase [Candidatus Marsarchaeota archaeon]|jgi:aspartate carbamoyltransferase catalytic subunit|nr:aspartate carbamoyltransferase [Candidatus Marsarchaeota archaeon]
MGGTLFGRDLVAIGDLGRKGIEDVLNNASKMLSILEQGKRVDYLKNNIMATLFFEPSTRTRLSFESAMQRLGGGVIGFADANTTSTIKGETLADTVRIVESYSDILVVRHNWVGAAREAAKYAKVPVINGGDGAGEHPTQALLDLFTIKKEAGKLNKLKVVIAGDLKYGRTSHSFAEALSLFGNEFAFVAPNELQIPDNVYKSVEKNSGNVQKSESLSKVAADADVIYMTRVQKERLPKPEDYQKFEHAFKIDEKFMKSAKEDVILMHPLPRVNEISPEVDKLKNSVYFKQAGYGIPIRMAVLDMILNGDKRTAW